jgi:long-chain acyl-CoA synthetase
MNLAIIGDNRPRLYWSFAAAQCLGGVPVPMYQDAVAQEMLFVLDNAEIEYAIVEDQEQVDKLLELLPQYPNLKHVFYDDARGLRHYAQPQLMAYDRCAKSARNTTARIPVFSKVRSGKSARRTSA